MRKMANNKNEEDWEESLVVMELNGIIDSDWMKKSDKWRIIGIESATPLLQMDHYVFCGNYEDAVGTNVMFSIDKNDPEKDCNVLDKRNNMSDEPYCLTYNSHTFKKLHMNRAFLNEKDETHSAGCAEPLRKDRIILSDPKKTAPAGPPKAKSKRVEQSVSGFEPMDIKQGSASDNSTEIMKTSPSKDGQKADS